MSLADKAKTRVVQARTTPIDRLLARIPDEVERAAALEILSDPTWTQRDVIDAFADEGYKTSRESVGQWRRKNGVTS